MAILSCSSCMMIELVCNAGYMLPARNQAGCCLADIGGSVATTLEGARRLIPEADMSDHGSSVEQLLSVDHVYPGGMGGTFRQVGRQAGP